MNKSTGDDSYLPKTISKTIDTTSIHKKLEKLEIHHTMATPATMSTLDKSATSATHKQLEVPSMHHTMATPASPLATAKSTTLATTHNKLETPAMTSILTTPATSAAPSPLPRRRRTKSNGCKDCARASVPLSHKDRTLITILKLVSFTFLALNFGQLTRVVVMKKIVLHTDWQKSLCYFTFQLTNNLCNLNYAINFGLYCYSGSRFRSDLKEMISLMFSKLRILVFSVSI